MNKLQCYLFVVLVFGIQLCASSHVRNPQIKVVGSQKHYVNPKYISGLVYTFTKVNATFNNMKLYWNVIRDAPADVQMYLKIYVTDSTYQGGKLVLDNITPICKENKNRELLPNVLIVPESELGTKCVKKGLVQTDEFQQYRFEILLPGLEKIGKYYRAVYVMGNRHMKMFNVTLYNEWGYLNDN